MTSYEQAENDGARHDDGVKRYELGYAHYFLFTKCFEGAFDYDEPEILGLE